MIYSDFKGLKLSRLGFGCMRFASGNDGEIDQAKVNAMFDLAVEKGVNYFDTAYPYLGGKSEIAMAEALKKYPRESYYIADKFPGHSINQPIDNIKLFHLALKKCNTDYFDFYLLHNVNEWSVQKYESDEYHIIPDMLKMKEEGKIRHFGFSFHGGCELLEKFLDDHEGMFDFVQIQLNYLDWSLQDAKRKYEILTERGIGVWVMEPCRGGKLAVLNEENHAKLAALNPNVSDASYAFRFLCGLPNVKVILSGMNEVSQVEDNLNTFETEKPLSEEELNALFEIAEGMKKGVPCTACRYCCEGCPVQLDIPYLLSCYNDFKYAVSAVSSMRLDGLSKDKLPSACIGCGQCTHACPQSIDVPKALAELSEMYAKGPKWQDTAKGRSAAIVDDLSRAGSE